MVKSASYASFVERLPQLEKIAQKFQLKIISIKSIQEYRIKNNL
jgi:3,4-dihydroxy-2-butanone 4-phosphate synthase